MKSLKQLILMIFIVNNLYSVENQKIPSKEELKLQFNYLLEHLNSKEKCILKIKLNEFLDNTEVKKKLESQIKYAKKEFKKLKCKLFSLDVEDTIEDELESYKIKEILKQLEKRIAKLEMKKANLENNYIYFQKNK